MDANVCTRQTLTVKTAKPLPNSFDGFLIGTSSTKKEISGRQNRAIATSPRVFGSWQKSRNFMYASWFRQRKKREFSRENWVFMKVSCARVVLLLRPCFFKQISARHKHTHYCEVFKHCTMCTLGSNILLQTKFPCSSYWRIFNTPVVDTAESYSPVSTTGEYNIVPQQAQNAIWGLWMLRENILHSPVSTTREY